MNKTILIIILIFSLIISISCNNIRNQKKLTENIVEINDSIKEIGDNKFKIKISGEYGNWGRVFYEYEMNSYYSKNLIINIYVGGIFRESYNKILSDNEIKEICEFIRKYDLNKEIEKDPNIMWIGNHGFVGHLTIEIDNKNYYKRIFSGQNKKSFIYEIINYLNKFSPDEYDIPIEYLD